MKHSKELEAVARALWDEYQIDRSAVFNIPTISWDEMDTMNQGYVEEQRQKFFNFARAALTAIREPTEGMIAANNFTGRHGFTAAIDYALRDTTGEGRSSSVSRPR